MKQVAKKECLEDSEVLYPSMVSSEVGTESISISEIKQ